MNQLKMETETPAESMLLWFNEPGLGRAILRWVALVPAVICIVLFSQLIFLVAISLFAPSGDQIFAPWIMNMLNAAFVPALVISYVTPIAPSFRRHASIALAIVAVVLVGLTRLAFELTYPGLTPWRYAWLVIAAALCGASVWFGILRVYRKESLREQRSNAPANKFSDFRTE